jgi:hypothetical protein
MLKCNLCNEDLPIGTSYKTSCQHLLCEKCANRSFSTDCYCPICKQRLQADDVAEILVGVPPAITLHDNIFQFAFQDTNITATLKNISKIVSSATEVVQFVNAQIADQIRIESTDKQMLEQNIDTIKNEAVTFDYIIVFTTMYYVLFLL